FDLDAPVVEIGDDDFAVWYRDLSEEPKKYEGKTVRFRCLALRRDKLPAETIVVGRHVMTCCVEDIQFAGLVCQWKEAASVSDGSWIILTARIHFKFNRAYGKRGPVLTLLSMEPSEEPEQAVATFY
ncbi:MAG: outer membrane insertion C- signal, partial [Oscillospiraceae bacterium]|nr:outer membrane insertion C- signal [Oscillospiraceae bacterium]